MPPYREAALFLAAGTGVAGAAEPAIFSFEMQGGGRVTAMVMRDGDDIRVEPEVLTQLGLKPEATQGAVSLASVQGLSYRIDEAAGAVVMTCAAECYAPQVLGAPQPAESSVGVEDLDGVSLDYDILLSDIGGRRMAAALLDAAVFNDLGFGESGFILQSKSGVTRLDTAWTIDRPHNRTRLRLGDSISRGGAWGAPLRFGGIKFGTDFSLDPGFVTFPTPDIGGDAALPSTVDLYIDDVRRYSAAARPGPFTIVDPPVVTGAGVAHLVVTDMLGREQTIVTPFYASRDLLKPGLTDYALDLGFERENFGVDNAAYGDALGAITLRRGLTQSLTGEARVEGGKDHAAIGGAVTMATYALGQVDAALAASDGARGSGGFARVGLGREDRRWAYGLSLEFASPQFARLGEGYGYMSPRLRANGSLGLSLDDGDSLSFSVAHMDERVGPDVRLYSAQYARRVARGASAIFSAIAVDAPEKSYAIGLTLTFALNADVRGAATANVRGGDLSVGVRAQDNADSEGGFGWRFAADGGAQERISAGATYLGRVGLLEADVSRWNGIDGLRGRAAGGIVWADGQMLAARSTQNGFALVVSGPNMDVRLDNRVVGKTDLRGRLAVSDLPPYESRSISIDVKDAPLDARVVFDEAIARPKGRRGVRVTFPVEREDGRWVRITDAQGKPAPAGVMLTRAPDGAAFFTDADGRAYLSANGPAHFLGRIEGVACRVDLAPGVDMAQCRRSP